MEKEVNEILFRYVIGMIIAIIGLFLPFFYFIFRPLTVWPTIWILKIFYNVTFHNLANISVQGISIEFIDACIAGSAYFLLFILNILTFGITFKKRVFVFVFDAALLLFMNILRLVVLIVVLVNRPLIFGISHNIFWYGISTIYVVLIWIVTVFVFKIRAIPFISDAKFILSKSKRIKSKIRSKT